MKARTLQKVEGRNHKAILKDKEKNYISAQILSITMIFTEFNNPLFPKSTFLYRKA